MCGDYETEPMKSDADLLRAFAATQEGKAFHELVKRHSGLVLGVAGRVVGGDRHLAEDIAQGIFVQLAREAGRIPARVPLTAWLHRRTVCAAANAVRSERRRKSREETAAPLMSSPENPDTNCPVDEALNSLTSGDRTILMLRFHGEKPLREIAEALGLSEDTAQKRVSRALDRLRLRLVARGTALSAVAVAATLTSTLKQNAAAAPAVCERLANRALEEASRVPASSAPLSPLAAAAAVLAAGALMWMAQENELRALRSVKPSDAARPPGSIATGVSETGSAENRGEQAAARPRPLPELLSVIKHEALQMAGALSDAELAAAIEEIADSDFPAALSEILTWSRYQKGRALAGFYGGLLDTWSRRDPQKAFESAARHLGDRVVARSIGIPFRYYSKSDPRGAVTWLTSPAAKANGPVLLELACAASFTVDPGLCLEACNAMPEGEAKRALEGNVLGALHRKSPADAMAAATSRPALNDRLRDMLFFDKDPSAMVTTMLRAVPEDLRAKATADAAFYWYGQMNLGEKSARKQIESSASQWLQSLPAGEERDEALRAATAGKVASGTVWKSFTNDQFAGACELASRIEDVTTRTEAIEGVMLRWHRTNKEGAAAYLDQCGWPEAQKNSIRSLFP